MSKAATQSDLFLGEHAALYAALRSRDSRFDGRVFVAVSSTGIYCRPVCHARLPKPENCTFYATAAQAEQAGYRPCLLCRPELAPGKAPIDATASLAERAARMLEESCGSGQSIERLAARLGYTSRHLRRAFEDAYQVTPVQYLQTCRLLLAKSLLTDTDLSVAEVAMAAGFGSIRRFNDLFSKQYRLVPTALRKRAAAGENATSGENASIGKATTTGIVVSTRERATVIADSATPVISTGDDATRSQQMTVALGYRPPYPWQKMLDFLGSRAIAGVEKVQDGRYWRTVSMSNASSRSKRQLVSSQQLLGMAGISSASSPPDRLHGWLCVGNDPHRNRLTVTVSHTLLPVLPQVLARVRLLFDLTCDPFAVYEGLASLDDVAPNLNVLGTRVPGCFDSFEMAVRAILGQQVTVKAASTLAKRLAEHCGTPLASGIEGLTHSFPTPYSLLAVCAEGSPVISIADVLGPLGIIASRSRTILALAQALESGELDLSAAAQPEEQIVRLQTVPGIGPWTAHYIAMRALSWPDAFLPTDYGIKKALPGRTSREIEVLAESWHPWRSYATMNLWQSLAHQEGR